ncbi:hypothetical protein ACQ3I4_01815 [Zafaria sp. Z1313]|uniref:hypothetical protein n=1 Tax=Zafaria sp. Z1313 TaxID=3423202 RepID=UPI003D3038A5
MAIIRTYRRDEKGELEFREAWYEPYTDAELGQFVVNHGKVGHQSTVKDVDDVDPAAGAQLMSAFAEQCAEDGFAEIPAAEQYWVVAQYALKSRDGTQRDEYLREKAVDLLSGHLAWRGLGTVESWDLAPWKLNVRILSPEPGKAVAAIKTCLREADLDFRKLSIAVGGQGGIGTLRQKHPAPGKAPFTLD